MLFVLFGLLLPGLLLCAAEGEMGTKAPCPKRFARLAPHPRLFVAVPQIERMVQGRPAYAEEYRQVAAAAEQGVLDAATPMREINGFQRGFMIQGRLTSLAIQWFRTKDRKYLVAANQTVAGLHDWIQPGMEVTLQEGQYMAGVAVAYDLLYNDLTPAERQVWVDFARVNCLSAYLQHKEWWDGRVSNWNPVCTSGVGMLALTMYEELDEAQHVLDRVQQSFEPIFADLQETHGGWAEGLGYWNWTLHYLSLFCMSYERATGEKLPGFHSPGFRETLLFGQYFVPNGVACGFGDNQHGEFSSSLFAAAEYLGYDAELSILQAYQQRHDALTRPAAPKSTGAGAADNISYGIPQDLLIEPDRVTTGKAAVVTKSMVLSYPKQGWGMLADQWPTPTIYAAVRGGLCAGDHTHRDLLSWHAVIGQEHMIHNIHEAAYYPTAFQRRSFEIYERSEASKNTLFVAGISACANAQAHMRQFILPCGPALRLEATQAFPFGYRGCLPSLVCRLFVVIADQGLLVLDHVTSDEAVPVEARAHTTQVATFGSTDVLLEGQTEKARMTFAADRPVVLRRAAALLTEGRPEPPTMMRWQTRDSVHAVTLASLLTRGADPVVLTVETDATNVTVRIQARAWQQTVVVAADLQALDGVKPSLLPGE